MGVHRKASRHGQVRAPGWIAFGLVLGIAGATTVGAIAASNPTQGQAISAAQAAIAQASADLVQAAAAPTPTVTVTATPTSTPTPTPTPTVTGTPQSGGRLFAATSLWNTTKADGPYVAAADTTLSTPAYGINNGAFDHPFYIAKSTDPSTTFKLGAGWGHPAMTLVAPAPSGMVPASGSDGAMDVQLADGRLLDMYGTKISGSTVTASFYGLSDANGTGFGVQPFAAIGTTAIGAPQVAGTILARDVAAGTITHALDIAFDYSALGGATSGAGDQQPPAVANDDGGGPGPLCEGCLLLIPSTATMPSGLSAMGQALWRAAQTYGVYITDQLGGQPMFYGDGSAAVGSAFTAADLTAVGRALRLVNTWGAAATPTPTPTPTVTANPGTAWTPTPGVAWQWEIQNPLTTAEIAEPVQAFDIDGFDNPETTVAAIHAAGKHAICYIDVGTAENFRPDFAAFPTADQGKTVSGFSNEKWLNVTDPAIRAPITARIQMCATKGFDAVEPDNMDGSENSTGFTISNAQQDTYDEWVAATVRAAGMSVAQKNFEDNSTALQPHFDFVIEEQCNQFTDCTDLAPYTAAHKAVFDVEYNQGTKTTWCSKLPAGVQGMDKSVNLTDPYTNCPNVATYP